MVYVFVTFSPVELNAAPEVVVPLVVRGRIILVDVDAQPYVVPPESFALQRREAGELHYAVFCYLCIFTHC